MPHNNTNNKVRYEPLDTNKGKEDEEDPIELKLVQHLQLTCNKKGFKNKHPIQKQNKGEFN